MLVTDIGDRFLALVLNLYSVTYTLCSKKYGVIQSSTWAENTLDAIYDLNVSNLECPGLSSVGDPSNAEKTLEVINGDIDAEYFDIVIDDEPVDDSISQVFKLLLERIKTARIF